MNPQISDARLAANRANAQHSTGPKTPEGKTRSSQNARTLGLFVSDATIAQENPEEFAELFAGYVAYYLPQSTIETELVRQLTSATWRLRRFDRIETCRYESDEAPKTRHEASVSMAAKFESEAVIMDRIFRARTQAERTFNRLYKDLEARKARRGAPREAPGEIQIEIDSRHQPFPQIKPNVTPSGLPPKPAPSPSRLQNPWRQCKTKPSALSKWHLPPRHRCRGYGIEGLVTHPFRSPARSLKTKD